MHYWSRNEGPPKLGIVNTIVPVNFAVIGEAKYYNYTNPMYTALTNAKIVLFNLDDIFDEEYKLFCVL